MTGSPLRPGATAMMIAAAAIGGGACVALGVVASAGPRQVPLVAALALTVAACLAAVSLLALDTVRRSRRTARRLLDHLERMHVENYTEPLPIADSEEFADLTAAIERMRERLRKTTWTSHYLDTVLNSMVDAVLVTDAAGRVTRSNVAAGRLFGWSQEELVGRYVATLIADAERREFVLARAIEETREYVVRTGGGASLPISLSGSRIVADPGSNLSGCIFVGHDITERRRAQRRVRYLARHDALTRVPNRLQFQHLLQQSIARARRSGTTLALFYLDLDRFKDVNDTFGHAAGDRTLEILSERLTRVAPTGAVIGRLAGDEFALFVENLPNDGARSLLATIARQLVDEIGRAFVLNQNEVYLTVSIGIALCDDASNNTIDIIRNADTAMYHAKQNGGGNYAFYDLQMNTLTTERLILKSKLRRSLELDEFVLLYQPKVDLATGRLAGAEALLRWRLPGHGDIAPAHFIPLAEQTNLIQPIGGWVLRHVCADYSHWREHVPDPGRISINLSLQQLQQASFITQFAAVFREYGVEPDRLELEITETTLMSNAPRTMQVLGELRKLGIRLSIDDFGTGFSSLSALQQMPVETLKIDQSFVRDATSDPDDATLVRTIIEMGRNLEMEVVAEGIETVEQLDFLRARGCHYGQGRLFGEPMTADAFLALLQAQARGQQPLPFAPPPPRHGEAG